MKAASTIVSVFTGLTTAHAGIIDGYSIDPNRYDRFTSSGLANPSPNFLGNGYSNSLTGVGQVGSSAFSVALVSERHFVGAAHVGYSTGTPITFTNAAGATVTAFVQKTETLTTTFVDSNGITQTKNSDVVIGTLTTPIPVGSGVDVYGIVKSPVSYSTLVAVPGGQAGPDSPPSYYTNQPLRNYGRDSDYSTSPHLGLNTLDGISIASFGDYSGEATAVFAYNYDPGTTGSFFAIAGDSGSPSFLPHNGELTLLGTHYGVLQLTNTPGSSDFTADSFLPYYTDQMNAVMAMDTDLSHPNGYQLRLITPVPEPWLIAIALVLLKARRRKP